MKTIIYWIMGIVIIGGVVALLVREAKKPGIHDGLAQCINNTGTKFYGAFWCPHCQATKALFGKSAKLLPYVECSTPDGKNQLPICKEAGIEGYPTWVFPDGSKLTGEHSLQELAEKTNCPLTQ